MVQCPACLPPDNAHCSTCGGTWSVTEEVAQAFLEREAQRNAVFEIVRELEIKMNNVESLDDLILLLKEQIKSL